jgi:hypothetical protein
MSKASNKAAGKTTAKKGTAPAPVLDSEQMRIDIVTGEFKGQPTRTVHAPLLLTVDGCHRFENGEREGRFGNVLPSCPTPTERLIFPMLMKMKDVPGVDEIRPEGHSMEIVFGRTFNADEIMPELMKIMFKHLGFKTVILSFWTQSVVGEDFIRVLPPPYALRVAGIKIEPLPEDTPATAQAGMFLQVKHGSQIYTVQIAGGDLGRLMTAMGNTNDTQCMTVVGVLRNPSS